MRRLWSLVLALLCIAAAPHDLSEPRAIGHFTLAPLPYFPGSWIALRIEGFDAPFDLALVGAGALRGLYYQLPNDAAAGSATLVAGGRSGAAMRTVRIVSPPRAEQSLLAVASYDASGVVFHQAQPPWAIAGVLGVGGAPADVAFNAAGALAAADTTGDSYTIATQAPWNVHRAPGAPLADELAFDPHTGALFISNRSVGQAGALTRISATGEIAQTPLGLTSEGLVIDSVRRRVYVANVNDGTVSIVDADTMRERERFFVVERAFALALDTSRQRLYVVSNESITSPFGAAGSIVAVDVRGERPRIVGHSARMAFPVGIALDSSMQHLFVTDEHDDTIDVLDATSLRQVHAPLATCRTPWKPTFDAATDRLFVPCARADEVDVVNARTLRRLPGAPFPTGGYPLAVAIRHVR